MAAGATVRDMLFLYSNARAAYERFIEIGSKPGLARNAVALLLWLDQGRHHVMSHVPGLTRDAVVHLAREAGAVLDRLHQDSLLLPPTPLMSALCCQDGGGIDPAAFAFSQDLIVRGVAEILDGIGTLIFNDRLYRRYHRHQTGLLGRHPELEEPYVSVPAAVPEDCRSMFITFSRGQSVERDEIFDYFRR